MTLSSSKDKSKGVILHTAYEDAYLPSVKLWAGRWAHWASDTWPVQNQTYVIFSSTEHHRSLTCTKLHFLPTMARVCVIICSSVFGVTKWWWVWRVKPVTSWSQIISNTSTITPHHIFPFPYWIMLNVFSMHQSTTIWKVKAIKTKSIWSDQGSWSPVKVWLINSWIHMTIKIILVCC